jgi:hypothetical protein
VKVIGNEVEDVEMSNLVGYRGGAENVLSSEDSMNLRNVGEESAKDGRRKVIHSLQVFDRLPRILSQRTVPDDWKLGSPFSPEM